MALFRRSGTSAHQERQATHQSPRAWRNAATADPRRQRDLGRRLTLGGAKTTQSPDGRYRDVR